MSDAQQSGDHYATLGLTPRSEDVVIRAAYIALMHRYHPDKSSSPASVERAQEIIAAFAVLGDPEKRIRYDWDRRRAAEQLARPPQSRLTRTHRVLIAAAVMLLLIVPLSVMRSQQTLGDPLIRPTAERGEPAALRPSTAGSIQTPKPDPIVRPLSEAVPMKAAQSDATLKPVTIEEQAAAPRPAVEKVPRVAAKAPRSPLAPIERRQARTEAGTAKLPASPSAKCLSARPGADAAVCKNDNLAALDRLGETYYGQSMRVGDATKRAALLASRNGLLDRRETCRSDLCLRSAYLIHMREISAIVERKQPTTR